MNLYLIKLYGSIILSNLFDYTLFINMYLIYNILKTPSFDFFNALIVSIGLSTFGVYEKTLITSTFIWIYFNFYPEFVLNRIKRLNVINKSFKLIDEDELYKTNKIFFYINYIEGIIIKIVNYVDTFNNIISNTITKIGLLNTINNIYFLTNNKINSYIIKFSNIVNKVYNNIIYNIVSTSKQNKLTMIKKEMEEFKKLKEEMDNEMNTEMNKKLSGNITDFNNSDNSDNSDTSIKNNMKDVERLLSNINMINDIDINKVKKELDDELDDELDIKKDIKTQNLDFLKNINFDKMFKQIIDIKDKKLKTQIDLIKKDI